MSIVVRALRSLAIAAVIAAAGCHRHGASARVPEPNVVLVVRNDGVFDVTIYALPSGSTEPRYRLGMVTGASTMTIAVPRHSLQASGALTLMLHAIGARGSWVSPSIVVPDGGTARLDIISDAFGDVSRSAFYAVSTTESRDTKR
jgi:hypothetical protein